MKFYIAASFERKDEVRGVYRLLQAAGHEVISDWTLHKNIKPYSDNVETAEEFAIEDFKGAKECEVFVILSEPKGSGSRGAYVELGAAICTRLEKGSPEIFVVGEYVTEMVFYFHPLVKRRKNVEEVLKEIESRKDSWD